MRVLYRVCAPAPSVLCTQFQVLAAFDANERRTGSPAAGHFAPDPPPSPVAV